MCGSLDLFKRAGRVRDSDTLEVLECASCGLVSLSDFSHISLQHYQNSGMFGAECPSIETRLRSGEHDDDRRSRSLAGLLTNKRILDFGCGAGGFLLKASKVAESVEGVEPEARVRTRWAGKWVIHSSLEDLEGQSKRFDVITAFHVLEHLPDPKATLMRLAALLVRGGRLVIEVPSADDALLTLYKCEAFQSFTYWSQHLFLFSASTLRALAKQAGLRVLAIQAIQRYSLANHLGWLINGRPGGHIQHCFLETEELNRAYASLLASLGKTDTLFAHLEPIGFENAK